MTTNSRGTVNFSGAVITFVRVVLGIFWLLQITWKPPLSFGCPDAGLCLWLDMEVQHPLIPLYADFVRTVVQPNVYLFGWITTFVEVGIGLSLLLGFVTRLGALVGVAWTINLLIGLAAVPNEQGWYYGFLILLNLIFVGLGAAGQISVDRRLGWPFWWARAEPMLPLGH